jgi:hypothetical protein
LFSRPDASALPQLTPQYQSNVPGLYVIGALGGYPLIKQAMNQGYEVIESILGRAVSPADEPLLEEKFGRLPFHESVAGTLALMQRRIPLFTDVNALMFRELMLGSAVHAPKPGEVIFRRNDYTNSFFTILSGSVQIEVGDGGHRLTLPQGQFFGEMSLLSGRRAFGHGLRRCGLRANRVAPPGDHEAHELGGSGEARGRPALRHPRHPDRLCAGGEL